MSPNDGPPRQLSRLDVAELAKTDLGALEAARQAGRLDDLLAGREPGVCPSCRRPLADTTAT